MNEETDKSTRIELLRADAADCTRCDLANGRTNVVFGVGNPNAPLVIIGEGPGENEDRTGEPFVGRAGILLDEVLRECKMLRKHVFITNVVRCRPTKMEAGRLQNRPPTTEEATACITNWLVPTLETIQPLVILALGAPASSAVIHKGFKMTQERGTFHESKYARYAIASWHPAYILRLQGEAFDAARAALVADMELARLKVIEARKEPPTRLFF